MNRLAAFLVLGLSSFALAWPGPADDPEPTRPPVELEVVGDRSLTIDRMGLSREAWIKAVKAGKVSALTTKLKIRVRNNLKTTLKVRVTGSTPVMTLQLSPVGKGEMLSWDHKGPALGKMSTKITYEFVPPGKWFDMELPLLQGFARTGQFLVWPSDVGDWKLTADFTTALYEEGPVGSYKTYKGTLKHTLKSRPITVTVTEK